MTDSTREPRPRRPASPRLADFVARPFVRFLEVEASSAIVLLAMAGVALVWANSPWGASYDALWHLPLAITLGDVFALELSLGHWVNDGLMTIFFFVVGMEIKREMVQGQLSTLGRALFPILAAVGGMVVPAGLYAAFHWDLPTLRGWGVPMATDIAFAVAALSVFGSRVPSGLRVFLLALAIADDLGAVTVIAVFYTEQIHLSSLGLAGLGLLGCIVLNRAGVRAFAVYVALGAFVWYETHHSGVHATIAGVALGLLTPTWLAHDDHESLLDRGRHALERLREILGRHHHSEETPDPGGHGRHDALQTLQSVGRQSLSPLDYLVNALERPVAWLVMPIFALANAGVRLDAATLSDPMAQRVGLAVAIGLFVGKPLGVTVFSWLAVRLGLAQLPDGVGWASVTATGVLAGIGFTVALFVTNLAFTDPAATAGSKIGILVGSAAATVVGMAILARALPLATGPRAPRQP